MPPSLRRRRLPCAQVLVNSQPRLRGFRSIAAYVLQDDVLFPTLTVRETFEFAANIRLPAAITKQTRTQVRGPGAGRRQGGPRLCAYVCGTCVHHMPH